MATTPWTIPTGKEITGSTYIKDTDNNLSDTIDDLVAWTNNVAPHAGTGLSEDFLDKASAQTATGIKTFDNGIVADVTGDVTGTASNATTSVTLTGLTSTVSELNILDGVTSNATELNLLDGVTSTTAELNILDGVTSTAAELNILDGATLDVTELNYVDGVTSAIQGQINSRAPLASPSLTGTPTVPTAATTTDTTQAASTAFVQQEVTASLPIKAWVNFEGVGVVAIRDSFGVDSITDDGVGQYTVNFTTAFPTINYAVSASQEWQTGWAVAVSGSHVDSTKTVSSVQLYCRYSAFVDCGFDVLAFSN